MTTHNTSPEHIRALLSKLGLSQRNAAKAMGISERMLGYYITQADRWPAPYLVVYWLETQASLLGTR